MMHGSIYKRDIAGVLQSNEAPKGRMRPVPAHQRGNSKSNQLVARAAGTIHITF